jgi:hypothetical protein
VYLGLRAERALKRRRGRVRERLLATLDDLEAGRAAAPELIALPDRPPWHRLSVAGYHVLLRPYADGYLVADVVSDRELRRAVESF